MRVKCLALEHNTVSPARARTQTTRSRDERTNHEATAPPIHVNRCQKKLTLSNALYNPLENTSNPLPTIYLYSHNL